MKELILQNIDLVAIAIISVILVIAILNVIIVSMLIKTRKTYKTFLSGADGKSLEAVMLKRLKEGLYDVAFFVSYNFQCHIMHCGYGCAYCNYRKAADNCYEVQNNQICHFR